MRIERIKYTFGFEAIFWPKETTPAETSALIPPILIGAFDAAAGAGEDGKELVAIATRVAAVASLWFKEDANLKTNKIRIKKVEYKTFWNDWRIQDAFLERKARAFETRVIDQIL